MIITNGSVKWTHRQALDSVGAALRSIAILLASETAKAAPAVTAAGDMVNTLAGVSAGIDALETLVAEQADAIARLKGQHAA